MLKLKGGIMPRVQRRLPPVLLKSAAQVARKAVEIANETLKESCDDGIAIATGLKKAREYFKEHPEEAGADD